MVRHRVTTKRLILRQWRDDDRAPYAAICADPDVMRYIAGGAVLSRAQTDDEIRKMQAVWDRRGFGTFAVEHRETGAFLGSVGFSWHDFLPDVSPCVEIGWRLARQAWGKGLATEAAAEALAYGRRVLGLSAVHAFCQSKNSASQRIAEKLGLELLGEVQSPAYDRVVMIYRAA